MASKSRRLGGWSSTASTVTWSAIGGPFGQERGDLAGEITNADRFDQIAVKTIAKGTLVAAQRRPSGLAGPVAPSGPLPR